MTTSMSSQACVRSLQPSVSARAVRRPWTSCRTVYAAWAWPRSCDAGAPARAAVSASVRSSGSGMAKVGVYGGPFDPPHVGHLILAEAAREQLRLDKVMFIPAGDP